MKNDTICIQCEPTNLILARSSELSILLRSYSMKISNEIIETRVKVAFNFGNFYVVLLFAQLGPASIIFPFLFLESYAHTMTEPSGQVIDS